MNRIQRVLPAAVAAGMLWAAAPARSAGPVTLTSPSGTVRVTVREGVRLGYEIVFQRRPVIELSALGIVVDGVALGEGAQLGIPERYQIDETYPWYGVHSTARNHCNGLRIPVKHVTSGTEYTVEVRAYDDGAAFRTVVPGEGSRVPDEATTFRLPAGSVVWYHDFEGHYEGIHKRQELAKVPAGEWAAPPLTFRLPGGAGYAAITEGALFGYSGMGLQAAGEGGFSARLGHSIPPSYPFRLRYKEEIEQRARPAAVTGSITTPWRLVLVGPDLNTLVNSDLVHAVAPPPDPQLFPKGIQTNWIKPGRAVWKYLDGGDNTLEEMREFSRLAGELGFEYNLIEGFWQRWTAEELKDFVDFSRAHHVGVWLWKHGKEIRDAAARREFFQRVKDSGAVGVKLDFFDHEEKGVVELYEAMLREAAEFQLLVNFHGSNKPAGESRTYPNELVRESIKGMEGRPVPRARHDATLPFTRLLAGHADYTPVHFGERRSDTTWAHQVASAAIYTAPLLVYGAHPANILKNPSADMLRSIPSVWDETRVLPFSEIGEVAAFARRRSDTWFVAIMNGEAARTVTVPLAFLGAGRYQALLIRDSEEDPAGVRIEEASFVRERSIRIALRAGGGFIGRFSK
jgi:alpha-glucosidase